MKTAKYCLIKQNNDLGEDAGCNIYVGSFQDACSYITHDLLKYYTMSCRNIFSKYNCENKLRNYGKYILLPGDYTTPKNLRTFRYIYEGFKSCYLDENGDINDINLLPNENLLLSNFIQKIIEKIVYGINVEYFYSFPIQKIEVKVKDIRNRQYRTSFHGRTYSRFLTTTKAEKIAGTDPEYQQYLSVRQKNRENTQVFGKWKRNRFQVPGDWKHYHKCRKQWAKNIKNPSYEKLSKAVFEQGLKEVETEVNWT